MSNKKTEALVLDHIETENRVKFVLRVAKNIANEIQVETWRINFWHSLPNQGPKLKQEIQERLRDRDMKIHRLLESIDCLEGLLERETH